MIFKDRNFLICHHRLKNRIHLHAPTFTITVMQNLRFVGLCFKSQGSVASSTFGTNNFNIDNKHMCWTCYKVNILSLY
ncbi:hypothetical protein P8452_01880 [Trifolium repens]|nr:hypothetical protein P8452_01880 [Trifolium repens]